MQADPPLEPTKCTGEKDFTSTYPLALRSTLGRTAARYPEGRFFDDLARLATGGTHTATSLIDAAGKGGLDPLVDIEDPTALAWFAFSLLSRAHTTGDIRSIASVFILAYRAGGYRILNEQMNTVWAGVLAATGQIEEFRFPLEQTGTLSNVLWAIDTDALHPGEKRLAAVTDIASWLHSFNAPLIEAGVAPITLRAGEGPAFERMVVHPPEATGVDNQTLVSVVMPVYNPGASFLTAVRSILNQTWQQLEVLLCDDASTENTHLFEEVAQTDDRVRIITARENAGAYTARNLGMRAARGAYITFNDADDWSHPQRIEWQMREHTGSSPARASASWGIRAEDDLHVSVLGNVPTWVNLSSLMFPRADLELLGGFDPVRKGADSEFFNRYRTIFGEESLREITAPLAVIQLTAGSLSRDDVRFLRIHPARRIYINAFRHWHKTLQRNDPRGFIANSTRPPFPAPKFITGTSSAQHETDILILANLDANAPTVVDLASEVRTLHDHGYRVGVREYLAPFDLTRRVLLAQAGGNTAQALYERSATVVLPDEPVVSSLVLIHDPAAIEAMPLSGLDHITTHRVGIIADYSSHGRYDPATIDTLVTRHLGSKPVWLPATPTIRRELLTAAPIAEVHEPQLIGCLEEFIPNLRSWAADRPEPPMLSVGVDLTSAALMAPEDLAHICSSLRIDHPTLQIVAWGPTRHTRAHLPRTVIPLDPSRGTFEELLRTIDVAVIPESQGRGAHLNRAALTALAHGCLVILSEPHREHFGQAALYSDPSALGRVLDGLLNTPGGVDEQRAHGREFLATSLNSSTFVANLRNAFGKDL